MQDLYNYYYDESIDSYYFKTADNIEYAVSFTKDDTLNSITGEDNLFNTVYNLTIVRISNHSDSFDTKKRKTIEKIILDFFSNTENTLIYFCSEEDNKSLKRYNSFNRWYKQSENNTKIIKLDNHIKLEHSNLYTSLMYHCDNHKAEKLTQTFLKIQQTLDKQ